MSREKGFLRLAKLSFAVIAAAVSTLTSRDGKAQVTTPNVDNDNHDINIEAANVKNLKPKLVLKVNIASPENSLLALHASHSSHASHASHASHSSHYSSSYGGSDYSTPSIAPAPAPVHSYSTPSYTPTHTTVVKETTTSGSETMTGTTSISKEYELGSRVLHKGCQGHDVEELQQMLVKLEPSLTVPVSGYFGDSTEAAVKMFQQENELKPDGKVGSVTLTAMKLKDGM